MMDKLNSNPANPTNSRDEKAPEGNSSILEMPVQMFKDKSTKKADLDKKVSRGELIDIIHQVGANINDISQYLMQDLNTLYSSHVFPFQIQLKVLSDLLVEKGVVTEEELTERYNKHIRELQEQARALKEDEDGVRLATKEEDKEETSKKVLEVLKDSEKEDKKKDAGE